MPVQAIPVGAAFPTGRGPRTPWRADDVTGRVHTDPGCHREWDEGEADEGSVGGSDVALQGPARLRLRLRPAEDTDVAGLVACAAEQGLLPDSRFGGENQDASSRCPGPIEELGELSSSPRPSTCRSRLKESVLICKYTLAYDAGGFDGHEDRAPNRRAC